jgi:hypothetical protein
MSILRFSSWMNRTKVGDPPTRIQTSSRASPSTTGWRDASDGSSSRRLCEDFSSERIVTNNAYAEQWKRMRRIHRQLLLSYLIGPIGFVFNHFLIDPTNQGTPGILIFTAAWLSFLIWAAMEYRNIRCPRCGQLWRRNFVGPWSIFLRHRCPHCGLELP